MTLDEIAIVNNEIQEDFRFKFGRFAPMVSYPENLFGLSKSDGKEAIQLASRVVSLSKKMETMWPKILENYGSIDATHLIYESNFDKLFEEKEQCVNRLYWILVQTKSDNFNVFY